MKNELINNEIKKIFTLDSCINVYRLLQSYLQKFCQDYDSFNENLTKLFIEYLEERVSLSKNNHFFENVLLLMNGFLNIDILKYLLSKDLDMDYDGYDFYGTPSRLSDTLALNVKNPLIMNLVLQKLDKKRLYFQNEHFETSTDLCRMNLIAHNYNDALKVFNNDNYRLFPKINEKKVISLIKEKENGVYLDEFNGEYGDLLYQILLTLKNDFNQEAKTFLKNILYSKKISLFNYANILILKTILDIDEYQEFIDYLDEQLKEEKITLYKTDNYKTFYRENDIVYCFEKGNPEVLKLVKW